VLLIRVKIIRWAMKKLKMELIFLIVTIQHSTGIRRDFDMFFALIKVILTVNYLDFSKE